MISQYKEKFKEELLALGRSQSTIQAYVKDLDQFLKFCRSQGINKVDLITDQTILGFLKKLKTKRYAPKSISRKLNTIRTFFSLRLKNGEIKKDPSKEVKHPRIPVKKIRVLTETEYMALRDACRGNQRLYTIVEILLQTGIKIGELCRLTLADVTKDPKTKTPISIHIREFQNNPARDIPLNKRAAEALEAYLKIRPKTNEAVIFVTAKGNPIPVRNVRLFITRAFEKAGIKGAKVNDLRNTFIVHQIQKGANLLAISKVVGHKRLSTTERYLKYTNQEKKEEIEIEEL